MALRRGISILAATLLMMAAMVLPLGQLTAYAQGDEYYTLSASVSPQTLAAPGNVTLRVSVSVKAASVHSMRAVRVRRGDTDIMWLEDIYPTAEGEGKVEQAVDIPVSAAEIGNSIPLKLVWLEDGETARERSFSVKVSPANTTPSVQFERSISLQSAAKDQVVPISYTITNNGQIDITAVKLVDEGVGFSKEIGTIKPGNTVTQSYDHKMKADFQSKPVVTYTANGQSYTAQVDAQAVALLKSELTVKLEASANGIQAGSEVTLLCTVKNSGSTKMNSLTIRDAKLGEIFTSKSSLGAGKSRSFNKSMTLTEETVFQFTVTGVDEYGNETVVTSDPLTISVNNKAALYNLQISATTDVMQLSEPGKVLFQIAVANKGTDSVQNVRVLDQNGKLIETIDIFPVGSRSIPYEVYAEASGTYSFTLTCDMGNGEIYRATSNLLNIAIAEEPQPAQTEDIPTPEVSPEATPSIPVAAPGNNLGSLLGVFLIVLVLLVASGGVLAYIMIKDKRAQQRTVRGGARPAQRGAAAAAGERGARPVPPAYPVQPPVPQDGDYTPDVEHTAVWRADDTAPGEDRLEPQYQSDLDLEDLPLAPLAAPEDTAPSGEPVDDPFDFLNDPAIIGMDTPPAPADDEPQLGAPHGFEEPDAPDSEPHRRRR